MRIFLFLIAFSLTLLSATAQDNGVSKSTLIYGAPQAVALNESRKLTFYFKFDQTNLDVSYMYNLKTYNELDQIFTHYESGYGIDTLNIIAASSPDGNYNYNLGLSQKRALSFKGMLLSRYSFLKGSVIETDAIVSDWSKLGKLIENDFDVPYRSTVLSLLSLDRDPGAISWKLQKYQNGEPWQYIAKNYMRYLRKGEISIQIKVKKPTILSVNHQDSSVNSFSIDSLNFQVDSIINNASPINISNSSISINNSIINIYNSAPLEKADSTSKSTPKATEPKSASEPKASSIKAERTKFLAVKTNLLYDATGSMNLGVEFGLSRHMTLDVSGSLNPWSFGSNSNNKFKHLLIQPELRYWVSDKLRGHFFGVHAHYAYCNMGGDNWVSRAIDSVTGSNLTPYRYEGRLGGAGLTYGYLWMINPRWGLEGSIGLGYANINYEKYDCKDCGQYQSSATKHYFGPTKAGVSLVFMIK